MKKLIVLAAVASLVAAGLVSWRLLDASPSSAAAAEPCAGDQKLFGHIESMARNGDSFELRFDPAWFLSGVTANVAAAEDGAVEPGQPVPNDNYVLEEGHRLLTYLVPDSARVTVLVKGGPLDSAGFPSTPISVADLAQLVAGDAPVQLAEPLETGLWMRVHVDTVCSLEQQYRP